jgi:predicted DNA-binding protein
MAAQPVNVKQVKIYLTHEQHDRLLALKEKTGAPVSEIIRRAIDQYLKGPDSKR